MKEHQTQKRLAPFWRAVLKVMFIVFLFYSNLLMGEFTHSGPEQSKGFTWAVLDIFTIANFIMAMVLSLIGYFVFELLRKRI